MALYSSDGSKGEATVRRVLGEHLHSVQGQLREVLSEHLRRLAEDVVRHRDDRTAAVLGLEDVEDLARARPEQLGLGLGVQKRPGSAQDRRRIDSGVRDPARKDRDHRRHRRIQRLRDPGHLREGEQGGHVELHAAAAELADQREA